MTKNEDRTVVAGTASLLASVFANLTQAAHAERIGKRSAALEQSERTLRKILTDWQQAYREIDSQLSQVVRLNGELHRNNDELAAQIVDLRRSRDEARADSYAATQRAVELETELAAVRASLADTQHRHRASPSRADDAPVEARAKPRAEANSRRVRKKRGKA